MAVDLSIGVVERLVLLQSELEESIEESFGDDVKLRLVNAPDIHVTLKFLGDTNADMVPMIEEVLERLCEPLFPFEVECRRVGVFPAPEKPRILWAGLDKKSAEVLGLLQKALERDLEKLGFAKESRPYHPHVTLARVKSRRAPSFAELIEPYEVVGFGKSFVKDIVLYQSHLDHRGARYEVLRRFALGSV